MNRAKAESDAPVKPPVVSSSPVLTARLSTVSTTDLTRKPPSQPLFDQIRIPASVGGRNPAGEGGGEPAQRSVQDLFNLQTKFLKTELHALGLSVRKRLLEQDAEISSLQAAINEIKSLRKSDDSSEARDAPGSASSSSGASDDILHSFASLIAMYAQPVDVSPSSVPRPTLQHSNGTRIPVAAVDSFSGHGHEAI